VLGKADRNCLEKRILAAHGLNDGFRLAELYAQGAEIKREAGELDAAGFLLTQAFVFALESGHPMAEILRAKLVADDRELNE